MTYFPLTRAQQRIYDLERFVGGAVSDSTSVLFRGTFNKAAMQRALNLIIETNDALRLRINAQGLQCVAPYKSAVFPVKSFGSLAQLHAWCAQQALVPLDIHGVLYDFMIVTSEEYFGVFPRFHHIIADAWTLMRFASLLYQYYKDSQPVESPSYLDYIEKEQRYLQSERYIRDRDYWLSQFETWPEPVFLARQATGEMAAARWEAFLAPEQMQPLRNFAAAHKLSLFNLLTTAMAVYLYRLRGQEEVCLGTTTLGRPGSALKKTLGMFAGTLPLPSEIDPAAGFAENARTQAETLYGAIRHEGFGYTDLLKALQEQTGFSGRLYDVMINYLNASIAGMDPEAFVGTKVYFCGAQAETLQLHANDRDNTGGLELSYDYQLAAFTQAEIEALHERLMILLHDAIAHPEKPVAQLEMLCDSDKVVWDALNQNEQAVDLQPVHRLFEEQVKSQPETTAVIFDAQCLSYQALNDWANRIAGWLREQNILPGAVVAIRMERCIELMPLIFGVMKAGCAYLPILPSWPKARVDFILKDAGAALLIDDPQVLHDLPPCDFQSHNDPALAAYVMYTSGSTGQPKGVRVGQAGLCNRLLWQEAAYPLAPDEMLIQKTSYAFDVSAWELFWPFMRGCALLLPEPGAEQDPRRLAELIEQHGIRTIHFVPSMLSLFLDYLGTSGCKLPTLERVIASGEALSPGLNRRFHEVFQGTHTHLINLYGPTECTVDVLYYDCAPGDEEIPIGRPVWNTQVYVLDQNGALLPPGEIGELCVSGVQLAYGYANPALDENRFVQHPQLGCIYKTGDQCSLRGDGQVLYHGREDGQVKIRGQRVELRELEWQLERLPGVTRAAAMVDGTRLLAFVCVAEDFDEPAAMRYLSERLPPVMLPERVWRVEEFPLNQNGKLDRKALARLADKPQEKSNITLPVTSQEKQLMAVVHVHLKGEPVGMDDAPARCGLSSLDIVSITLTLEAQGMALRVNDFYMAQSFTELATMAGESAERPAMIQLSKGEGETACVGVPYGGGGFASWADVTGYLDLPFYAVKTAHEDPNELFAALKRLPHERFVLMGSCVGTGLAVALAQLLQAEDQLAGLCVVASVPPPFVRGYGRWLKPWTMRGPAAINRALQKLSARELLFGAQEIAQLRKDAAWFVRFLARNRRVKLQAPIHLVYGDRDPALQRANAKVRWERLFGRPVQLHIIPGAKHDVVHTHPQEIAEIILL